VTDEDGRRGFNLLSAIGSSGCSVPVRSYMDGSERWALFVEWTCALCEFVDGGLDVTRDGVQAAHSIFSRYYEANNIKVRCSSPIVWASSVMHSNVQRACL